MPKKKKTTEPTNPEPTQDTEPKAETEDLWTYQLTITRTKPRAQLPNGKLGPSRVEKVYTATSHNSTSPNNILQEATERLLNQHPWHGQASAETEYEL